MIAVTVPKDRFELPIAWAICQACKGRGTAIECRMPARRGGRTDYEDHRLAEAVSGFFKHDVRYRKGWRVELLCRTCAGHLHELASKPAEGEKPYQAHTRERLCLRLAQYLGLPVPTCSKCQAGPAMPCRDCGVLLCEGHGDEHDPPDCPVAWQQYLDATSGDRC